MIMFGDWWWNFVSFYAFCYENPICASNTFIVSFLKVNKIISTSQGHLKVHCPLDTPQGTPLRGHFFDVHSFVSLYVVFKMTQCGHFESRSAIRTLSGLDWKVSYSESGLIERLQYARRDIEIVKDKNKYSQEKMFYLGNVLPWRYAANLS